MKIDGGTIISPIVYSPSHRISPVSLSIMRYSTHTMISSRHSFASITCSAQRKLLQMDSQRSSPIFLSEESSSPQFPIVTLSSRRLKRRANKWKMAARFTATNISQSNSKPPILVLPTVTNMVSISRMRSVQRRRMEPLSTLTSGSSSSTV